MNAVVTEDPCCLGPDVVGFCTPDKAWAWVPDIERSGSSSQIITAFEAGHVHGSMLLTDLATAGFMFERARQDLLEIGACLEGEAASFLLALWRLPSDRALLLAADADDGFARAALSGQASQCGLSTISRFHFDARSLLRDPEVTEGVRTALERLVH